MSLSYCDAGRRCHRERHLPGSSSPQLMGRETTVSGSSCGHRFCWVSQSLGEETRSLAVQGACCGPGCGFGKGCVAPSGGQARSEPRLRQDCRPSRLGVSTSPGDAMPGGCPAQRPPSGARGVTRRRFVRPQSIGRRGARGPQEAGAPPHHWQQARTLRWLCSLRHPAAALAAGAAGPFPAGAVHRRPCPATRHRHGAVTAPLPLSPQGCPAARGGLSGTIKPRWHPERSSTMSRCGERAQHTSGEAARRATQQTSPAQPCLSLQARFAPALLRQHECLEKRVRKRCKGKHGPAI